MIKNIATQLINIDFEKVTFDYKTTTMTYHISDKHQFEFSDFRLNNGVEINLLTLCIPKEITGTEEKENYLNNEFPFRYSEQRVNDRLKDDEAAPMFLKPSEIEVLKENLDLVQVYANRVHLKENGETISIVFVFDQKENAIIKNLRSDFGIKAVLDTDDAEKEISELKEAAYMEGYNQAAMELKGSLPPKNKKEKEKVDGKKVLRKYRNIVISGVLSAALAFLSKVTVTNPILIFGQELAKITAKVLASATTIQTIRMTGEMKR